MSVIEIAPLPSPIEDSENGWNEWQLDTIRALAHAKVGESLFYGIVCGADLQSSGIEDAEYISAAMICLEVYDDEIDEMIQDAVTTIEELLGVLSESVAWARIEPSVVEAAAARMNLPCRFQYYRKLKKTVGVVMNNEEIIQMERTKSDDCQLNLVHFPDNGDEFAIGLSKLLWSYIESLAGPTPEGVALRCLWRPSQRWTSRLTGEAAKFMVGWGLDYRPEARPTALEYADRFRFAAYSLLPHIDWHRLSDYLN